MCFAKQLFLFSQNSQTIDDFTSPVKSAHWSHSCCAIVTLPIASGLGKLTINVPIYKH